MNFIYKMSMMMSIADRAVFLYKYMELKINMILLDKKYLIILIKLESTYKEFNFKDNNQISNDYINIPYKSNYYERRNTTINPLKKNFFLLNTPKFIPKICRNTTNILEKKCLAP